MSGQREKLINFCNLFKVFENLEVNQFSQYQKLLKSNGVFLRFHTQKENLVNGLFGPTYGSDNYDYTGIHHLLNSSNLFRGINNYCSQKESYPTPLDCLNKFYINSNDVVEISLPQVNVKKQGTMFSFSHEQDCPLSNKELIKKVIDDGFLDLNIKIKKESSESRVGYDESNWRKKLNLKDDFYFFNKVVEMKFFEIQNILKKDINSKVINYIFNLSIAEKELFPLMKHEDKVKKLFDSYCGKYDLVWLYCYFNNVRVLRSLDKEGLDTDFNEFLINIELDLKIIELDAENQLSKLENNLFFEVFKND